MKKFLQQVVLYLNPNKGSTTKRDKVLSLVRNALLGEDIVSTLMKIRERVWATRKKNDGKEINVTLEDALFSAKSMAKIFGPILSNQYRKCA